jgi:thiol:disulfide interchange protein
MNKQRIFLLAALAVLTIIAAGLVWRLALDSQSLAEATTAATPPHIDQSTDTLKQISDSLAIAKRDNKRVLLQFGSRGCTWCHLLHHVFDEDKKIAEELKNNYIIIEVDISDGNNAVVDGKYGTPRHNSLPFTVILDSDGKQLLAENIAFADEDLLRQNIARINPDKVLALLKKWSPQKSDHAT